MNVIFLSSRVIFEALKSISEVNKISWPTQVITGEIEVFRAIQTKFWNQLFSVEIDEPKINPEFYHQTQLLILLTTIAEFPTGGWKSLLQKMSTFFPRKMFIYWLSNIHYNHGKSAA